MYRVLLKVFKVQLHIKEPVIIEIQVRHKKRSLEIPNRYPLIQGESMIDNNYQFHITEKNPVFEICLIIYFKNMKKLAGSIQVNLHKWPLSRTVRIEQHLNNCPDKNSLIQFQFMYLDSPINFMAFQLVGEEQIQTMKNMIQHSALQQQKSLLQNTNKFLELQYKKLVLQNEKLNQQLDKIEEEQNQIEQNFQNEVKRQEKQTMECLVNLQKQKMKMAQILDLISESGDPRLMQKVQQIINQNTK